MSYLFAPPATVGVPIVGRPELFPVNRVYCVGRNYEDHAKEMGFTGREPPFFFLKPANTVLVVNAPRNRAGGLHRHGRTRHQSR
jgi:fumarylpyruvate hydrolase